MHTHSHHNMRSRRPQYGILKKQPLGCPTHAVKICSCFWVYNYVLKISAQEDAERESKPAKQEDNQPKELLKALKTKEHK